MRVPVLLFAEARRRAGVGSVDVELPEGATVAVLKTSLAITRPTLAGMLGSTRIAVNGEYAVDERVIASGDEIALIPPVSGGSPEVVARS